MNELMILRGAESRRILRAVIEKKASAIMSYLSGGKWYVAKVLLTGLEADVLNIEVSPGKRDPILQKGRKIATQKPRPINIRVGQPVGMSLKYEYGKFIFETKVVSLEPSADPTSGGMIVLAVPEKTELVQKRNYFRVQVPRSLDVNVLLWHRRCVEDNGQIPTEHCLQGKLVDISAGGIQIAFDAAQRPNFRKRQFARIRFTPMPYEAPLTFNAQIRSISPTADGKSVCFGLQMVGLEASTEGRLVLHRLCNVVAQYYQISQSSARQQDFQTTSA